MRRGVGESISQLPLPEEDCPLARPFVLSRHSTEGGPPGETIYRSVVSCPRRVTVKRSIRGISGIVSILVVFAIVFSLPPADGALRKPTYAAGDKWVYALSGTLAGFPGFNASQGTFHLGLVGFVYVNVIGSGIVLVNNGSVSAAQVDSRATGFLNGTFSVPGAGNGQISGSFTSTSTEFWEAQAYLPIESLGTTSYHADVTLGITTPLVFDLRVNATTSFASIPPFELDVGQNASAAFTAHVELNSTFTAFFRTMTSNNVTDLSSTWHRDVLSRENVSVEAGTFSAYKLNQTLGSFPGIPSGLSGGGNETAYFSNDVGFYVKRVAYENGTPAAEMRLRSYSFGAGPPTGISATQILLFIVLPIAVAVLVAVLLWRRRKARIQGRASPPAPPAAEGQELGGKDRAR